jgi:hypothetical protein
MAEEDNPFLVKKKPVNEASKAEPEKIEEFSFMVSPEEAKKIQEKKIELHPEKPHYEQAGTPIWDKSEVKDIHNPDYEVVDHKTEDEEEES